LLCALATRKPIITIWFLARLQAVLSDYRKVS
jgi:hypothetical protein